MPGRKISLTKTTTKKAPTKKKVKTKNTNSDVEKLETRHIGTQMLDLSIIEDDKMQSSPSPKKDSAGANPLINSDQKIMQTQEHPKSKRKQTLVLAPLEAHRWGKRSLVPQMNLIKSACRKKKSPNLI